MHLQFSTFRPHLQHNVLKKLEFRDFAHFKQCSQTSLQICSTFKTRLPLDQFDIEFQNEKIELVSVIRGRIAIDYNSVPSNVRFVAESIDYKANNEEVNKKILGWMKMSQSRAEKIFAELHEDCPIDHFSKLLDVSGATRLTVQKSADVKFLQLPQLKHIIWNDALFSVNPPKLTDEEFLSIKAATIQLGTCQVTLQGLNTFLKKIASDERYIERVALKRPHRFNESDEHILLAGLDYTEIEKTDTPEKIERKFEINTKSGQPFYLRLGVDQGNWSWYGIFRDPTLKNLFTLFG